MAQVTATFAQHFCRGRGLALLLFAAMLCITRFTELAMNASGEVFFYGWTPGVVGCAATGSFGAGGKQAQQKPLRGVDASQSQNEAGMGSYQPGPSAARALSSDITQTQELIREAVNALRNEGESFDESELEEQRIGLSPATVARRFVDGLMELMEKTANDLQLPEELRYDISRSRVVGDFIGKKIVQEEKFDADD